MDGNKAALLIGVSEYRESGLKSLPSATGDIQAMQRVLTRSSEFATDQIRVLANPQKQEVEEAIYWLFADRQKWKFNSNKFVDSYDGRGDCDAVA